MEETIEVEKLKSHLSGGESTLLADNKLVADNKLASSGMVVALLRRQSGNRDKG